VYSNGSRMLAQGEIFLANRQQVHFYENYDHDKRAFCVVLSNKYTHDFRERFKKFQFPSFLMDKAKNAKILALLEEWIAREDRSFLVDCAYANFLLDILVKEYGGGCEEEQETMNQTAIRFIEYINENYDKNLTLEESAAHFGYSKEYFSKKFKARVGKNFLSFLNFVRLQKAKEMLDDPDIKYSVKEICAKCGFNNAASFYRCLKKEKNGEE
jgi:YesN/AraC family two-component response regulator